MMENISDIISSLTPDDIENLKQTANSIFGNTDNSKNESGFDINNMLNPEMFMQLTKIIGAMNSDGGKRARLLEALKPNLSKKRQKKVDDAIQIMKLLDILPLINNLQNRNENNEHI